MISFANMLARVKRQHPGMDDDEAQDLAHQWCCEASEEDEQREDSPSIEDTLPEEVLALRNELREDSDGEPPEDPPSAEDEARRAEIITMAKDRHGEEGEVEIDDNAKLSEGDDNGAYVQAWVWVPFEGTKFDRETPSSPIARDAASIGARFIELLKAEMSPLQFAQVQSWNAAETDPRICHSHDFCDANMVMLAAFWDAGMQTVDTDEERALWDAAWAWAKANGLGQEAANG